MTRHWIRQFFYLTIFSIFFQNGMLANIEQDNQYRSANEHYKDSNYDQAIEIYEQLVENGYISDDLFANMGNAYLKKNRVGQSIISYEKALLLNQGSAQANKNLLLAKERVINPVTHIPDFFLLTMWRKLVSSQNVSIWILIHCFLLILSLALAIAYWTSFIPKVKETLKNSRFTIATITGLVLLSVLCLFAALERQSQLRDINYGIVMKEGTPLLDGPDDRSNEVTLLSEGLKAKILDQIDDWYKIQLDDKDEGWVEMNIIELIKI